MKDDSIGYIAYLFVGAGRSRENIPGKNAWSIGYTNRIQPPLAVAGFKIPDSRFKIYRKDFYEGNDVFFHPMPHAPCAMRLSGPMPQALCAMTFNMQQLKNKITQSPHTRRAVAAVSFLESTVMPIPLELLLIPLMQIDRKRMWQLALAALLGCIGGALFGYAAANFFQASVGDWIVSAAGGEEQFARAGVMLREKGFWFVLSVGVAPVPFQIAMVAAGVSGYSIFGFLAATALSRALRYFGLAALVWRFGDAAEEIYKRHRLAVGLTVTGIVVLIWIIFGK